MNDRILGDYKVYRKETGDPVAAALLVLATAITQAEEEMEDTVGHLVVAVGAIAESITEHE